MPYFGILVIFLMIFKHTCNFKKWSWFILIFNRIRKIFNGYLYYKIIKTLCLAFISVAKNILVKAVPTSFRFYSNLNVCISKKKLHFFIFNIFTQTEKKQKIRKLTQVK